MSTSSNSGQRVPKEPLGMLATQFEQNMEEIENESSEWELSRYLADKREKITMKFDILECWKVNSNTYLELSLLVKDILVVSTFAATS